MSGPTFTLITPSRLHFGLLAWGPDAPRQFGGVGLMIDEPGQEITSRPADDWSFSGPHADRVAGWARDAASWFSRLGVPVPPLHLKVRRAAPAHVGLGSGTQLALATARLVAEHAGRGDLPPNSLAESVGRGKRSGIGIAGFESGGLIVDGGHAPHSSGQISRPIARLELPRSWRVLVVVPRGPGGLHGEPEVAAFRNLPPFPAGLTDRLCRLVLLGLLPAVAESNLPAFSASLEEIQQLVGEAFSTAQGGTFAGPGVASTIDAMKRVGLSGVGQSSWGPAVYGFVEGWDDATGDRLVKSLLDRCPGLDPDRLHWARPSTRGAILTTGEFPGPPR